MRTITDVTTLIDLGQYGTLSATRAVEVYVEEMNALLLEHELSEHSPVQIATDEVCAAVLHGAPCAFLVIKVVSRA